MKKSASAYIPAANARFPAIKNFDTAYASGSPLDSDLEFFPGPGSFEFPGPSRGDPREKAQKSVGPRSQPCS
jgi:hypothetical protein